MCIRDRDWGTYIFKYERHEVKSFLLASACYWLEEYHFDGLRVDAVASMLYLDFARGPNFVPTRHGARENLAALEFPRQRDPAPPHARPRPTTPSWTAGGRASGVGDGGLGQGRSCGRRRCVRRVRSRVTESASGWVTRRPETTPAKQARTASSAPETSGAIT